MIKTKKMKNHILLTVAILMGCSSCKAQYKSVEDFVPKDYIIYEKSYGDLNKDGQEDCILIIKGTNKSNIVLNQFDDEVDRNRRGIIVLLKNKKRYQLAVKNMDCFYSENEDGGNYYAPQLSIGIENGDLIINYEHGRYGYWSYTFRYHNSKFQLIGYDATEGGVVISSETSINFLTKKKLIEENTNYGEGNDAIFKETWSNIEIEQLINLSEIKAFEGLDLSDY